MDIQRYKFLLFFPFYVQNFLTKRGVMRKINLIISTFLVSLLLLSVSTSIVTGSENKDNLLKEAQILYKAGSQYVDARFKINGKLFIHFNIPNIKKPFLLKNFNIF